MSILKLYFYYMVGSDERIVTNRLLSNRIQKVISTHDFKVI